MKRNTWVTLIVLLSLVFVPQFVFADMALPGIYYVGMSTYLIFSMIFFDAVVLTLLLKLLKRKIFTLRSLISLITIFSFGLIGDITAIFFAERCYQHYFPRYIPLKVSEIPNMLQPSNFYMINTYMKNYTISYDSLHAISSHTTLIILAIVSFLVIFILNLSQKTILKVSQKKTLLLALLLGVFTNPIWGLSKPLFILWLLIMVVLCLVIYFRRDINKT